MPSDSGIIIITTGIGVGVIAGLLSGVCYVLLHSKKRRKPGSFWHCAVCRDRLPPIRSALETATTTICTKCKERVCKVRCSKREYAQRRWICHNCQPSWIKSILDELHLHYKALPFINSEQNHTQITEMEEDTESTTKNKDKEYVRDFIERLVGSILGGNVDDASISRIYSNKEYLDLFDRYHEDLSNALTELGSSLYASITSKGNLRPAGQSPHTAHSNIKQIIERVLKDVPHLANLRRIEEHPAAPQSESVETYEDFLATAILNKVVSNSQRNLPSSSTPSTSSRRSTSSSRKRFEKEYFFGEETLSTKWRHDYDTSSNSSSEDFVYSDSSLGSTKYVDRVSLTIQQGIEELDGQSGLREDLQDDADYFRANSSLLGEDSNWSLKKRFFSGHSPVPVPMLVPHPTTETRVLIGDKQVEDTSDLSDAASDDSDIEDVSVTKSFIVESKTIIGGKNPLNRNYSDHSSTDSGVREDDEKSFYSEVERKFPDSKKREESEERIVPVAKPPIPRVRSSKSLTQHSTVEESNTKTQEEASEPFQGQYCKKDKEKWSHPVPMDNNPYTKENLEQRIQATKYGSDYYAKLAATPTGTKKKEDFVWPNQEPEESIFKAIVVNVEDEDSLQTEEPTSDSDLSFVNCYDVENSKIYHESFNGEREEVFGDVQAEGLSYTPLIQVEESTFTAARNQFLINTIGDRDDDAPPVLPTSPPPNIAAKRTIFQAENPAPHIAKKADNTLIGKIYSDPIVRKYRDQIPPVRQEPSIKLFQIPPEPSVKVPEEKDVEIHMVPQKHSENFSLEVSDVEITAKENTLDADTDISELKEKRIVANRLGKFCLSFPNLLTIKNQSETDRPVGEKIKVSDTNGDSSEGVVSVKELKKMFENDPVVIHKNDKPFHSLTARSLPKEMRDKLRKHETIAQ